MRSSIFLSLVVVLGASGQVEACSCVAPPPAKEALEQSHAVFTGKVSKIEGHGDGFQLAVTIEIATTWKGIKDRVVVVHTASDSAACGVHFEVGKSYLVYAYLAGAEGAKDRPLTTNICTRTRLLDDEAKAEVVELGPPDKMPTP